MRLLLEFIGRFVLGRMTRALTGLLGLAHVMILHWAWVVLAQRPLPGPLVCAAVAGGLVAFNVGLIPVIRARRNATGHTQRMMAAYYTTCVATILLAGGVGLGWGVGGLAGGAAWLLGAGTEASFGILRAASAGSVAVVAGLVAWGFTGGQWRIRLERHRFELEGLPPGLEGLRLLQVSDLHIGNRLDGEGVSRLVDRIHAQQADVIVLTGDLFDADPTAIAEGARALGELRAPLGVYAIFGNHDVYVGLDRVARAMAEHAPGIRLLRRDLIRLPHPEPFYLAGLDDPPVLWTARDIEVPELEELADKRPDDGPTVLLVHRPELFGQARRLGFPLVLAGHTHGGQVAVPGLERPFNVARLMTRYDRGLFHEGGSTLYVNRGLGVAGPGLRIAASREMALFELRAPVLKSEAECAEEGERAADGAPRPHLAD